MAVHANSMRASALKATFIATAILLAACASPPPGIVGDGQSDTEHTRAPQVTPLPSPVPSDPPPDISYPM